MKTPNRCFRKRHQLDSGEARQIAILVGSTDRTRSQQLSKGSLGKRDRGRSFASLKIFRTRACTSCLKRNCVARGSDSSCSMQQSRRPSNQFRDSKQRTTSALSTMLTTQTLAQLTSGIVLRSGTPVLLLGRPLKASAAWVGRFVSTGPLSGHDSAAAAVSCRGRLSSFPFPDFDFIAGMCGAVGVSRSPSSKTGTVLVARRRRFSVSTSSFAFLRARRLMDTGTMLELECTLVSHLTEIQFGFSWAQLS